MSGNRCFLFLLLLTAPWILSVVHSAPPPFEPYSKRKCEPITIQMCKGLDYNMTSMPNRFNHQQQEEAGLEVHQFFPLVEVGCSPYLKFFLCSMYTPICLPDYDKPLPPCRSVCENSKRGCAPLMEQYGFAWPENLDCSRLPLSEKDGGDAQNLCMEPPSISKDSKASTTPATVSAPPSEGECKCSCLPPFVVVKQGTAYDAMRVGNVSRCAYPCKSPFLTNNENHQNFLTTWVGVWSISCCLITFLTVVTFLVDMDRFQYPERPVFFIAFCYFMVSVGYIVRLVAGHERTACDANIVRAGTTGPATCTVVFLFVYFFGMASSVWWVVLSFTWFLAAGLKWSNEAIAGYSQYFHIFAWALPSVKTVVVLALSAVDGDHLAGICYVGNTNVNYLRAFVLGPLVAYWLLGFCFLTAGFASLIRIHKFVKAQHGHSKTEKLEQLMVKIGIFSVLYSVPAACVIFCLLYEQHYRTLWELSATCPCVRTASVHQTVFALALVRYSMSLVVGVTVGLWIWSPKTLASWRLFCCRLLCCRQPPSHRGYRPAEAIIVKSHTDLSSQAYSGSRLGYHPPVNHL